MPYKAWNNESSMNYYIQKNWQKISLCKILKLILILFRRMVHNSYSVSSIFHIDSKTFNIVVDSLTVYFSEFPYIRVSLEFLFKMRLLLGGGNHLLCWVREIASIKLLPSRSQRFKCYRELLRSIACIIFGSHCNIIQLLCPVYFIFLFTTAPSCGWNIKDLIMIHGLYIVYRNNEYLDIKLSLFFGCIVKVTGIFNRN